MAKAPAIENVTGPDSLHEYLIALPPERMKSISQAIALRCSLTALPSVGLGYFDRNAHTILQHLTLSSLRCVAISHVALKFPIREVAAAATFAENAANFAAASASAYSFASANTSAVLAANSAAHSAASATTFAAYFAANKSAASSAKSAAKSAASAVKSATSAYTTSFSWEFIRIDLKALEFNATPYILSSPLWQANENTWQSRVENFRRALITMSDDDPTIEGAPWLVWWDWYEPQINGGIPWSLPLATSEAIEMRIALGDSREDFWDREPNVITQEIDGWVREARGAPKPKPKKPPTEFDQSTLQNKPASVQTRIDGDQITEDQAAPSSDMNAPDVHAASQALANDIRELSASISQENFADPRLLPILETIAENIAAAPDDQVKLFESGRNLKFLESYATTVTADWGSIAAAKYHSLILQFGDVLKKFKAWRDFIKQPPELMPHADINQFAKAQRDVIQEFKALGPFISQTVWSKLNKLQSLFDNWYERYSAAANQWASENREIEQASELLLGDIAESIGNVVKSIGKYFLNKVAKPMGSAIDEDLPIASAKLGKRLVAWTFVGGPLYAIAYYFPATYKWLQPLADFIKQLML